MQILAEHPRVEFTIGGRIFQVPEPFAEGHTLTEGQADALNQVLRENVRNNLAKKEDLTQADIDDYVEKYEFGVRTGGGGRVVDPIMREALTMAVDKIKEAIRSRSDLRLSDYKAADITGLAKQYLDKHPEVIEEARSIVERKQRVADATLEGLGI